MSNKLNLNPNIPLSQKEKVSILISSRTFTIIASILTFGIYYLYYLFCLEESRSSPLNPPNKEGPTKKYTFEKPLEAEPVFKEASGINSKIFSLIRSRKRPKPPKEMLEEASLSLFNRLRLHFSIIFSNIVHFVGRLFLLTDREGIDSKERKHLVGLKSRNWAESAARTRDFFNRKIQKLGIQDPYQASMDSPVVFSMTPKFPTSDHYIPFMFYFTYFLLSLITLGLFPLYHLLYLNRKKDLKNILLHRHHSSRREFDEVTDKLVGTSGHIEYSYLLLGTRGLSLNLNFFCDAFRTKVFGVRNVRRNIIIFLMVVTLGLYGVWIMSKSVFDRHELSIPIEDSKPTDYTTITDKWQRFRWFLVDLIRDLNVANKIAARRLETINKSIGSVLIDQDSRKSWLARRFLTMVSSELYYWLFSFLFILIGITSLTIIICQDTSTFHHTQSFWFITILFIIFQILFTRHINLLFV